MLASRRNASSSRTLLSTVSSRARAIAPIVAVFVLGIAFGALVLDSTRTPAGPAPESSPSVAPSAVVPVVAGGATPSPAVEDPCPAVAKTEVPSGQPTRFPAKTVTDVLAWAPKDPYFRYSLESMASVRPGPIYDPRVPRCRIDLLVLGQPAFARAYPQSWGSWLVPVRIGDTTIATFSIGVDSVGIGAVASIQGGAKPTLSEAGARIAGGTTADPVISAELVYAAPFGCAPRDTLSWRLVRRSGTVVYLPDYAGAFPGALFGESEMRFMSVPSIPSKIGELASAC
jgi:hypothetical protein